MTEYYKKTAERAWDYHSYGPNGELIESTPTVTRYKTYRAYGPIAPFSGFAGATDAVHYGASLGTMQNTYFPGSTHLDDLNAKREKAGEHPQLFDSTPTSFDELYSHPDIRHAAVPTLLALAYNDAGGHVEASDSLSEHSSRLAVKAQERGWIKPNPLNEDAEVTNDLHLRPYWLDSPQVWGGKRVPDADLKGAKRTLRQLMRPTRTASETPDPVETRHLSGQFQPQLPGFEG